MRPGEDVVPIAAVAGPEAEEAAAAASGVEGSSSVVGVALCRLRVKGRRGTGRMSSGPSSDMVGRFVLSREKGGSRSVGSEAGRDVARVHRATEEVPGLPWHCRCQEEEREAAGLCRLVEDTVVAQESALQKEFS